MRKTRTTVVAQSTNDTSCTFIEGDGYIRRREVTRITLVTGKIVVAMLQTVLAHQSRLENWRNHGHSSYNVNRKTVGTRHCHNFAFTFIPQ